MNHDIYKKLKKSGYSHDYALYAAMHPYCELSGCGSCAMKPHHIKSRGAGGQDNPENLLSLCGVHDRFSGEAVHIIGWRTFAERHPEVRDKMYKAMGEE